ncbi:MAG: hypothetical protein JKX98_12710 [Alcanivoracaceae bacterium]|nr:hypothetical protein [Alcanivoracaceae bacterium]
MKTKIILMATLAVTMLIPQLSHARLCSAVANDIAITQSNIATLQSMGYPAGVQLINLAVLQQELQGCTDESSSMGGE